jgi:hygromycin-B 4-O-kinase
MGDLRPSVHQDDVTSLLNRHFDTPIQRLQPVEGGQVARTFSFAAGDREYIVRFNRRLGANFEKELVLARLLAATDVPIPPVVDIGRFGELHYAITEKLPGTPLQALALAAVEALVPAMLRTLDAIHAVDVSGSEGYGVIGDDGNGLLPSWRQSLESIREEQPDWDYFGKWHVLFETTFLERDLWESLYEEMVGLLGVCPEERYLIHSGFDGANVLAQDGEISAVLDWIGAAYGDFLFDSAWLAFWTPEIDWAAIFRDHYARQKVDVPHFSERLRCYQLHSGLDALRFFAKKGDEDAYRWTRDRLLALRG